MKIPLQTSNHTLVVEQEQTQPPYTTKYSVDCDMKMYSSMKELSKGFMSSTSPSSSSSSFLEETTSNSSFSSSAFSLSSTLSSSSSYFSGGRPRSNSNDSFITAPKSLPVVSQLPSLSKAKSKVLSTPIIIINNNNNNNISNAENGVRQPRPRRIPSQILLAILSLNRDQVVWEEMEDNLYILLDGKLDRLQICKEFYIEKTTKSDGLTPRRSCAMLRSLGYLLSSKADDMAMHDEHISRVASFLSTGRDPRHLKLVVLQTLYNMCNTSFTTTPNNEHDNRNKNNDADAETSAERLYEFLTNRTREWEDLAEKKLSAMTDITLVYELRAKCLRDLDLERERIRCVTENGDNTAVLIATGAKIVELGIQKSNKAIEGQISNVGKKMKGWIYVSVEDQQHRMELNTTRSSDRDAVVVRAFSGSTKRASEYARQSTKRVAQSTLDTTLSGLYTIGNKIEETNMAEQHLSPESREMIKAAGKVGMASVGAVALVAEAIMETSRSVSAKTVGVTADIVGHKYGSVAGEVAQNAADTYTNVLQTMGNVTLMANAKKIAKTVAKKAGKNQIDGDIEKAKQIILRLERQGAIVAKQTLGIQWVEGSLTKELLCAASENEHESSHQQDNYVDNNNNETSESRDVMAIGTVKSPTNSDYPTKAVLVLPTSESSTDSITAKSESRRAPEIKIRVSTINNNTSSSSSITTKEEQYSCAMNSSSSSSSISSSPRTTQMVSSLRRRSFPMDDTIWSEKRNDTNRRRTSIE